MALVSACIVDIAERVDESGRLFLAYTIETVRSKMHRKQKSVYSVQRRYADFVALHARLQPEAGARRDFPVPKQGFERALNMPLSPQKSRDRANGLQHYLHELVASPPIDRERMGVVHAFLGIGLNDADPSVIIVGGGVAGLAAAQELSKLGIDDILLLEAGDRLGGRLRSIDFCGQTVEAGAQWVHGCRNNPIFERVAKLGLHGVVEPDAPIAVRAQNTQDLAGRVEARLAQLDEACVRVQRLARETRGPELAGEMPRDGIRTPGARTPARTPSRSTPSRAAGGPAQTERTVLRGLRPIEVGSSMSLANGGGATAGVVPSNGSERSFSTLGDMSVRCALRWCGWQPLDELDSALEHWRWDYDYGESPDRLSLRHNCAEEFTAEDFDSADFVVADPRGFATLAEDLASSVFADDDPRLKLCTRVTRIERAVQGGLLVTTDDGQVRGTAYVLLTVSIGVLQSAQIKFVPELPLSKLQPLHELTMGAYTKIYLCFPSKFWPEDQRHILIAHPRRGLYGVVTHLGSGVTRYPPPDSHILCVTVTGDEARRVELLSDDEIADEIMQLFGYVWGEQAVPDPIAVQVCRWSTDPLFMGAFSAIPPNALQFGHARLRAPVGPIHFAGEAFHERYSGFLQGAYLSGEESARDIASALAQAPPDHSDASLLFKPLMSSRSPAASTPGRTDSEFSLNALTSPLRQWRADR